MRIWSEVYGKEGACKVGKFGDYWATQCGNPHGVIGKIMTWGMNRANKVLYKGIVNELALRDDLKLLDIGFGNGYLEKLIFQKGKCIIKGIDISEDMVKKATAVNKAYVDAGRMSFALGDCCDLDFEDKSIHVVTTINTIYFWEDTMKGMKEIYRVLTEDGVFYNAVLTKESLDKVFYTKNGFKKFEKEEYIALGKKAGFTDVTIKPLGHWYGLLITYKK